MRPALYIWRDAGEPEMPKCTEELNEYDRRQCALCGDYAVFTRKAAPLRDALGAGFTDWDKLSAPHSDIVCQACVFAMGSKPPETFRLWSVLWREDWPEAPPSNEKFAYQKGPHTCVTTKADMGPVVETLLFPPRDGMRWSCSIADSGQIHTLPFATVNWGDAPWTVRFEREDVRSTSEDFAEILYHAMSLLCAGFIREDVLSLEPHPSKLVKHGIDVWRSHAEPLRRWRRSAHLALAVTLAKREEYEHVRARADAARARPCSRGDEQRIDGQNIADGLVAESEVGAGGGSGSRQELGAGGQCDVQQAPNRDAAQRYGQLSLFDEP